MPYLNVEGVRIYYEDEGKGQPLVLIHGASQDTLSWLDNISHLAKSYRVVAIDTPGHGKSGLVDDRPTTNTAEFSRIVFGVITALKLEQTIIIGHSLGAGVAIWTGLDHPQDIRGVVAVCGGAAFRGTAGVNYGGDLLRYIEVNPTDWLETMLRSVLGRSTSEERCKQIAFDSTRCSPYVVYGDLLTYTSFNFNERLHEVKTPIYYMVGEDDWSTTPAMAQGTVERLKANGATADCMVLKGLGHIPHWEQPAVFNKALDEVLGRFAKAPRTRSASK